jgi:hypothetical protein
VVPIHAELRVFSRRRRQLVAELALCAVAALALLILSPRLDGAPPDAQAVFIALCALFGACSAGLVPRAIPVLLFRCPRCRERFHGGVVRRLGRLPAAWRCCGHCGLPSAGTLSDGSGSSPT